MTKPSVITIGNFDGVHVGHRAILAAARDLADQHGARVVAMTFDPHPAATLDPANLPPRLCTPDEKVQQLKQAGADEVTILKPDHDLLDQTPETFINELVGQYVPKAFVEGKDFHFGKDRAGDIHKLTQLGQAFGFNVVTHPSFDVTLSDLSVVTVRSSVIRRLVSMGRIEDAHRCLGRPFALTATIVKGEQRGRTLGFPTINLDLDQLDDYILPADGVYAGYAHLPATNQTHPAAISVGVKPSFGKDQLTIEAHLPGFDAELYGQTVTLGFQHWLRDQSRFPGIDALKAQLDRDIEKVKSLEPTAFSH